MNTVLWNTIQLLFPQVVEARKAAKKALECPETDRKSPERGSYRNLRNRNVQALNSTNSDSSEAEIPSHRRSLNHNLQNRSVRPSRVSSRGGGGDVSSVRRRRGVASQDEDAALALRLQREEFMGAFRGSDEQQYNNISSSISLARANLRAMASRAVNIRIRGRPT